MPISTRAKSGLSEQYVVGDEINLSEPFVSHRARRVATGDSVAITFLSPDDSIADAQLFRQQFRRVDALVHPQIVPVLDSGPTADGGWFFVRPFDADVEPLVVRLNQRKPLSIDTAVGIATETARALQYAHERGVAHLALAPSSVWMDHGVARLADLAIVNSSRSSARHATDSFALTPLAAYPLPSVPYMAPEQLTDPLNNGQLCDIYALGSLLYEMLAGEPPHGRDSQSIIRDLLTLEPPKDVRELRPEVPREVAEVLSRALALDPRNRWQSAEDFAEALTQPRAIALRSIGLGDAARMAAVLPWFEIRHIPVHSMLTVAVVIAGAASAAYLITDASGGRSRPPASASIESQSTFWGQRYDSLTAVVAELGPDLRSWRFMAKNLLGSDPATLRSDAFEELMVVNTSIAERDRARVASLVPPSMSAPPPRDSAQRAVFFATTREVHGGQKMHEFFRDKESYPVVLRYGIAVVSIPVGLRLGTTDARGVCRKFGPLMCPKTPTNSMQIVDLDTLPIDRWREALSLALGPKEEGRNELLLFVHGFRNSFRDAVIRAAQMANDINFDGTVAAFDWASVNQLSESGYRADETIAEASGTQFQQVLTELAKQQQLSRVIIVAHSMGTRLTSYALRDLSRSWPKLVIDQVVFAASDIDSATFVTQLAPPVRSVANRVTLYGSAADRALRISANIHGKRRRVGAGPPSIVMVDSVDYVDASGVDTDLLGHAYVAENRLLLSDLHYLVRLRLPARQRYLQPIPHPPSEYYRFRP